MLDQRHVLDHNRGDNSKQECSIEHMCHLLKTVDTNRASDRQTNGQTNDGEEIVCLCRGRKEVVDKVMVLEQYTSLRHHLSFPRIFLDYLFSLTALHFFMSFSICTVSGKKTQRMVIHARMGTRADACIP